MVPSFHFAFREKDSDGGRVNAGRHSTKEYSAKLERKNKNTNSSFLAMLTQQISENGGEFDHLSFS